MDNNTRIIVLRDDVYVEVAKATDYTGSKLEQPDDVARDRIVAVDEDFAELGRFWDESVAAVDENFKDAIDFSFSGVKRVATDSDGEIVTDENSVATIVDDDDEETAYKEEYLFWLSLEVSRSWDTNLIKSLQSSIRSFFIASIIGQWFKFANKGEAEEYLTNAGEFLVNAEKILYARRRPSVPTD